MHKLASGLPWVSGDGVWRSLHSSPRNLEYAVDAWWLQFPLDGAGGGLAAGAVDGVADAIGLVEAVWAYLSPAEQQRARELHLDKVKRSYVAARFFLRQVLAAYLQCAPLEVKYIYGAHGKPGLAIDCAAKARSSRPLQFNLSHSGDSLLCAVSSQPLGVDIECMARKLEVMPLATRFFSAIEVASLQAQAGRAVDKPAMHASFMRIWTLKEAFVKAIGEGLSFPLHKFAVEYVPESGEAALLSLADNRWSKDDWRLCALHFPGDHLLGGHVPGGEYVGALACAADVRQLNQFALSWDQLLALSV